MTTPIGPSDIGTAGQVGFGVGVSLPALPAGYTYLGTTDRSAPNFGRYLNASAQPETWVPACWLRVGSAESPRFAEFGVDAVDEALVLQMGNLAQVVLVAVVTLYQEASLALAVVVWVSTEKALLVLVVLMIAQMGDMAEVALVVKMEM